MLKRKRNSFSVEIVSLPQLKLPDPSYSSLLTQQTLVSSGEILLRILGARRQTTVYGRASHLVLARAWLGKSVPR